MARASDSEQSFVRLSWSLVIYSLITGVLLTFLFHWWLGPLNLTFVLCAAAGGATVDIWRARTNGLGFVRNAMAISLGTLAFIVTMTVTHVLAYGQNPLNSGASDAAQQQ